MSRPKLLIWLCLILFSVTLSAQAQEKAPPPLEAPKYRMELIYIFEDSEPEFIFVVGSTGFKSVASLKKFVGMLPAGSVLEWAPCCKRMGKEPLLSSEQDMKDFMAFCAEKKINFILIPSG